MPDKLGRLQQLYGTLSLGPMPPAGDGASALPAFPVNGHGSFVSGVPSAQGPSWFAGSTFHSDVARHRDLAQEHAANFRKLQALLPTAAQMLQSQFLDSSGQQVQAWQGSRCVTHDRLPLVGPLEDAPAPSLWLCAGMGARGLSFSALCAELLAAEMCSEPLPLESSLAKSLSTRRARRTRAP
jgi:tRNA 5-methylaminomethyl-2-thiouridine biosynthesis bifunctional protein